MLAAGTSARIPYRVLTDRLQVLPSPLTTAPYGLAVGMPYDTTREMTMKRSMIAIAGALALAAAAAPAASAKAPAPEETAARGCAAGHVPGSVQNQSRRALRSTRAGDAFVWHNRNGWHLRVRHNTSTKMTFTGTIKTNDGKPIDVRGYRLEKQHGDVFSVSADKTTVTFLFNNYGGLDGLDMNMHCSASVTFTLSVGTALMNPDRIHLGRKRIEAFSNPLTIERRR
jgi:uncharacterized membrane protein